MKLKLMPYAWYYTFQKNGETITVISRVPVHEFEAIHNCWVEDLEVVDLV